MSWFILFAPALVVGSILALLSAPLGCLVLWRQFAFFADTLAHGALLGIALAFIVGAPFWLGLLCVTLIVVALLWFTHTDKLPNDALLSGISVSLLSLGMVIISKTDGLRGSMMSYLFGDLLTIGWAQVPYFLAICLVCLIVLVKIWSAQVKVSIHKDLAFTTGIHVQFQQVAFMLLLAVFTAVAIQAVGSLLVSSLLVLPALSARLLSHSPKQMLICAIVISQFGLFVGMASSIYLNVASGLAIVLVLGLLFISIFSIQKSLKYCHKP